MQARSPTSEYSEKSGSGGGLDEQDDNDNGQSDNERTQDIETDSDERKPYEGMPEFAESTWQELCAIYGLAGGELAKSVSRQLPPSFFNPTIGQQPQGESTLGVICILVARMDYAHDIDVQGRLYSCFFFEINDALNDQFKIILKKYT